MPRAATVPGAAFFAILSGPKAGSTIELEHLPLTIGRSDDADITIAHDSLSRTHARIEQDAEGFRIIDLDSNNGLKVNRMKQRTCLLKHGDHVKLGRVVLVFTNPHEQMTVPQSKPLPVERVEPAPESASQRVSEEELRARRLSLGSLPMTRPWPRWMLVRSARNDVEYNFRRSVARGSLMLVAAVILAPLLLLFDLCLLPFAGKA